MLNPTVHYKTFIEQTLHYFDRPHEAVPTKPIASAAAWRGRDLPPLEQMAHVLSRNEREEMAAAVEKARLYCEAAGAELGPPITIEDVDPRNVENRRTFHMQPQQSVAPDESQASPMPSLSTSS